MTKIRRVGHVVFGVRDPQRSITFYTETLGMELVTFLDDMQMAFFSLGERDHDLAVIKVPDEQPVGSSGLAHAAFEIEGGSDELQELYTVLKARGVEVDMIADHVITKSIYVLDPDGNRLEFYSQTLASPEGKQYLRDARVMNDVLLPLDLEPTST